MQKKRRSSICGVESDYISEVSKFSLGQPQPAMMMMTPRICYIIQWQGRPFGDVANRRWLQVCSLTISGRIFGVAPELRINFNLDLPFRAHVGKVEFYFITLKLRDITRIVPRHMPLSTLSLTFIKSRPVRDEVRNPRVQISCTPHSNKSEQNKLWMFHGLE